MANPAHNQNAVGRNHARSQRLQSLALDYAATKSLQIADQILLALEPYLKSQAGICASRSRRLASVPTIEPDDALQVARLAVMRSLDTWQPERARFWTWTHQKVRSDLWELTRTDRRRTKSAISVANSDTVARELAPMADIDAGFTAEALSRALGALPDRERQIVELCDLEQHSQAEVAKFFGICEARVSQLRANALKRLRQLLPEWVAPDF